MGQSKEAEAKERAVFCPSGGDMDCNLNRQNPLMLGPGKRLSIVTESARKGGIVLNKSVGSA